MSLRDTIYHSPECLKCNKRGKKQNEDGQYCTLGHNDNPDFCWDMAYKVSAPPKGETEQDAH
jgi:hypothetical protein